ncbi:hypothetical protein M7I_1392 [Glarea lozoyensis 74030]|uniref:Uncharacterized protein n=1 Tax=Glarea lozoyensis (strain ATCC 74030 / MF5533) TaxID=1104152 RepID=H0EFY4_GLAL7|nr:hypothetical protein M7I_1392 [Glarea lozoyensis 74030]
MCLDVWERQGFEAVRPVPSNKGRATRSSPMTGYTAEVLLTVVAVIGLYLKDFEKLSAQARKLNNKTTEIIEAVARDSTAADCIQLTNKELVNTAAEWDNGIRTALVAWEDFIEMQRCRNKEPVVDIEKQKRKNAIHLAKQRRKHAKFMIKFMRAKVLEGISQREDLNAQLQRIHMAVKTRWEAERANQYLKDDLEIQFAKNVVLGLAVTAAHIITAQRFVVSEVVFDILLRRRNTVFQPR